MISKQKKFLFIHVPKTGGNSIQNILRVYSENDIVALSKHQDGVERFEVRSRDYNITKHSTLSHYKSVLDPKTYRSLFKFATIRNPWDRMVSFYFSPHRGITDWDRNDFLTLISSVPPLHDYIYTKSFFEKGLSMIGMYKTIGAHKIGRDINFLVRFERLSDDFRLVCEKLDIPYFPLPKRNSSNHVHYSKYYDDKLKEIVRQKFLEEITFGNYHFESA